MPKKIGAFVLGAFAIAATPGLAGVDAAGVFEQLKVLQGSWRGHSEGHDKDVEVETPAEVVHDFRVSAAGTVVMETMGPGTDHEMINMYHVDGEDLLLTHYCAGGNQPRMRLDREESTPETLVFDFLGGTNLDPAMDAHIHSARITLIDAKHVESVWTAHQGGKQVGVMAFHLARSD